MASSVVFTGPGGSSDPLTSITKLAKELTTFSSAAMVYSGSRQITRIRERTAAGTDVNGSPFTPYSSGYAKERVKRGRNAAPVDLLMSGRMLNSLRVEAIDSTSFSISVQDAEAAVYAQAHNEGLGHEPRRRFFDISQSELDAMFSDLIRFDRP